MYDKKAWIKKIDEVIARGPYRDDWNCPEHGNKILIPEILLLPVGLPVMLKLPAALDILALTDTIIGR